MGPIALIVALVIAGLVLLMLEILTPSFGLLAASAVAALCGAVWVCYTVDSRLAVVVLVVLLVGVPCYLVFMVRWLPTTALGQHLFLRRARHSEGEGVPDADELAAIVGRTGTAETLLRPSGAIRVDGKRIIALSESGIITKGQPVKVVRAGGSNVIVRKAD